jgi:hypothetical protein
MPRLPTKTTAVIPTRVWSVWTGAGTGTGAVVWPSSTWTAQGSPSAVVQRPSTIGALRGCWARRSPQAARAVCSPSGYAAVTSSKTTGGAPPRCRTVRRARALRERHQHRAERTTDGLPSPRAALALAVEGTAQGVDPLRRPRGQRGAGPRAHGVSSAAGCTPAHGRRRVASGHGCERQEGLSTTEIPSAIAALIS